MSNRIELQLENGKYTYVFDNGKQYALRHGEHWRDLLGDKFVYCLAHELSEARSELEALKARSKPSKELPEDVQAALRHALDVMSKHGDGFTSVGATTVIEDFMSNPPLPEPIVELPPYGFKDNPGMGFPAEWENYSSEKYRNMVIDVLLEAGISAKVGDKVHRPEPTD